MCYQVGDRVVIKPEALLRKLSFYNGSATQDRLNYYLDGTDRVVEIIKAEDDSENYEVKRNDCEIAITASFILGYAFEYGEEIEVSDTEGAWSKRRFITYNPGGIYPVTAVPDGFKSNFENGDNFLTQDWSFARPIRNPEIEIACKINGEEKPLSDISEETLLKIRKEK